MDALDNRPVSIRLKGLVRLFLHLSYMLFIRVILWELFVGT